VRLSPIIIAGIALPLALTACGSSTTGKNGNNSSGAGSSTSAAATACAPVSGASLTVLTDDKHLQSSDNITPVVRTDVAKAPLTAVLNALSATLSQDNLVAINKSSDVDHESADKIASDYLAAHKLPSATGGSGKIVVVAAGFSESTSLATLYAKALKAAGYDTTVKQSTNREVYSKALESGEVQVVPEYAATLTAFLDTTAKTSGDITQTLAVLKPLATAKGLTVLDPAAATDENAFAVTKTFATKYGVHTLSDLAAKCGGGVTLGGPSELETRPYGEAGLKSTYGLKVTGFTTYDSGGPLTKNALKQGKLALGLVFSSDSSLVAGS
jgi:osmoprotectant transport system substrate-binding protein